jgi:hypothetical protein
MLIPPKLFSGENPLTASEVDDLLVFTIQVIGIRNYGRTASVSAFL